MKSMERTISIIVGILSLILILWLVYNQLCENLLETDPKIEQIKEIIMPLFSGNIQYEGVLEPLNKRKLLDEVRIFVGDKSYTINKEKIYLCLKDENSNYYDDNMLIYVLLHEISHVICSEIGHTPLFHKIFEKLLKKAEELQIYNSQKPIIMNYCMYQK